ncbi:MAG TPA: hypothetical protein VJ625_17150 [Propionibacteriaceae bacterium]|nr:hypothetical protein [Propionibacteriaceae bacterium]
MLIDGIDLSDDHAAISSISSPRQTFDKPGLRHRAMRRIYGKKDGMGELSVYFNPATNAAHDQLSTLPAADRELMLGVAPELGAAAWCMRYKQIGYDGSRPNDGDLMFGYQAQANGLGLDCGKLLTAGKRTDTTATNGTGVDQLVDTLATGSYAFGLQAFLQVTAFTGTNCTVKLQESSDNGAGDAWTDVTGGAFTAVTAAPYTQRIQTGLTQTVERYLRVVTTGTFTSITFAVMAHRNEAAFVA